MKVLVATKETQGARKNDFSFVDENDFVTFSFECDGESVDGGCGCRRSMTGLTNSKSTTTMKVVEMNISGSQYIDKLYQYYSAAYGEYLPTDDILEMAQNDAKELQRIASVFNAGAILEKRGNNIQVRK